MRITKCDEKGLENSHYTLKWGDGETPKVSGIEAVDIGMENALAFPKVNINAVLRLNPQARVSTLINQ